VRYAGIVTRGLALVVDAAVINVIAVIVAAAVTLVGSLFNSDLHLDVVGGLLAGAGWILWVAFYFGLFWTVTGQTPGNRLFGIQVVSVRGGTIGWPAALLRFAVLVLCALPLFLGFLPVLFDPLRRGFHDRAGGTLVRWVPAEQPAPSPPLLTPGAATSPGAQPPPGS
jgi:uncharacterized RDD family membrane protein YckC